MAEIRIAGQGLATVEQYYQDYGCRVRELKGQGSKVIGYLCSSVPLEIITAAGLVLGLKLLESPLKFVGISVSRSKEKIIEQIIQKANAAADFMNWDVNITPEDMIIYDGYVGEGYGVPTKECLETIKLVAQTEGFFIDPEISSTITRLSFFLWKSLSFIPEFSPTDR